MPFDSDFKKRPDKIAGFTGGLIGGEHENSNNQQPDKNLVAGITRGHQVQSDGTHLDQARTAGLTGGSIQNDNKTLNMMVTIVPQDLNSIGSNNGWEEIQFYVDSGATETVVGEGMLLDVETKEGTAKKRGIQYEVANGSRLPNLGEKVFVGESTEGIKRQIRAQVCDVNKPLLSVSRIMNAGNRVVFDLDGSYIEDQHTKEKIWMEEQGGMFSVKLWVPEGTRNKGF